MVEAHASAPPPCATYRAARVGGGGASDRQTTRAPGPLPTSIAHTGENGLDPTAPVGVLSVAAATSPGCAPISVHEPRGSARTVRREGGVHGSPCTSGSIISTRRRSPDAWTM